MRAFAPGPVTASDLSAAADTPAHFRPGAVPGAAAGNPVDLSAVLTYRGPAKEPSFSHKQGPTPDPKVGATRSSTPLPTPDPTPTVPKVNHAPVVSGEVYLDPTFSGTTVLITDDDLLSMASDPDANSLRVTGMTVSSGTILQTDVGWVYTPDREAEGQIELVYSVTDGTATTALVAHLSVTAHEFSGTSGDDTLAGTEFRDHLTGLAGDDRIEAFGGVDIITGGSGHDVILAGTGDDQVFGEGGNDDIAGDDGLDDLNGGSGNDTLSGGAGDDILSGGLGDDRLGDATGSDVVRGDAGDDTFSLATDATDDFFSGGSGTDTLDLSAATQRVIVILSTGHATGVEIGDDRVTGFEVVRGGSGDDILVAGASNARFEGGAGNNSYVFARPYVSDTPGSVYEVVDFAVGDRVRIGTYDFFERTADDGGTGTGDYFNIDTDRPPPIEFRHYTFEGEDRTEISLDTNHDSTADIIVQLVGNHNFFVEPTT